MLISICIPTYSRLDYLKQAVQSAKAQTYKEIEICISQNPKEEGPDAAIKEWCLQEEIKGNLVYNLNKENLGLAGNLNALAKIAKGKYVIFLGDDDLLHEDFVTEMIKQLPANAGVIFCNQFFIDANGRILEKYTHELNKIYKRDGLKAGLIHTPIKVVFDNSVPLSASLIKKDILSNYLFNEKLNTPELPFFLQAAIQGYDFAFVNKQLAYFRLHHNSETANGLTSSELLNEIISIQMPEDYEHLKRNYISLNIVPAINKALANGNLKLARSLMQSGYYSGKQLTKLVQKAISYLSANCIKFIFKIRKLL